MKQFKFTSEDFISKESDDCYLDSSDPAWEVMGIKRLAGIPVVEGSNISKTASINARIMKEKNIKPGTSEWFQLWFSLPYLTGEKKV